MAAPNRNQGTGTVDRPKHSRPKHGRQGGHSKPPRPNPLDQPLFPGGITTQRQFIQNRKAAADAEFRPQEEAISQQERQIPAYYQDYLAKMQALQQSTASQFQGLQQQAGSLDQPVGSTDPAAQQAQAARGNIIRALQASLIQQQGAQNTKIGSYGAIAGMKSAQGLADLGKARQNLAKDRGDFYTKYTAENKQREFENALAAKQFGLKETENQQKLQQQSFENKLAKQQFGETQRSHQAGERISRSRIKAETERANRAAENTQNKVITSGAFAGKSQSWLSRATDEQKEALIRRYDKKHGKSKTSDNELTFRTAEQLGKVNSSAAQAKGVAEKLKSGQEIRGPGKNNQPGELVAGGFKHSRQQAAKIMLSDSNAPEPVVVSAILDAVYDGHISRETAQRLHSSNIKVEDLANSLGVPTYNQWARKNTAKARARTRKNTQTYRDSRAPQPQGHY